VFSLVLVGAGLIGGVITAALNKSVGRRNAMLAGACAGMLHGVTVYFPLLNQMPFTVLMEIIISLAVLEMLAVYAFVALMLGFLGDERRKKLEKLLPEMKLKFLQAQINPHFLFNALNTIAAVCSRERAEQARSLVVKLSNYFRRIVKREDEWVSLQEEFEHIDSYLEIEKARYQNALEVRKDIALSPQGQHTQIPILIIQPLVENAIRHGIAQKSGGGVLEIIAWENGKRVEIMIRDNGVGIPPERLKQIESSNYKALSANGVEQGSGIGLRNINERLQYQFGSACKLKIQSEVGKGTVIQLHFPLNYEREE